MSFLFPAFLLGALAIAVPIVLHLLRRDVAPEVPFTAVRLLKRSPLERSRRRRLRDLILLAARVVALALLAIAFARPYLRSTSAASAPVRIVAIDRSFSMGAPGRFEAALDLARRAIDEARTGEQVALLAFDDRPVVLAPFGPAGNAKAALNGLHAGAGATRYAAAVAAAAALAANRPATLVLVTDMQRVGWENEVRASVPASLDVSVRDVGPLPPNLAVSGVRVERDRVVATIMNSGPSVRTGRVNVTWADKTAGAVFTVEEAGTTEVPIPVRAPTSGSLAVTVEDPPGFAADNTRYALLDPAARSDVLVVAGSGGPDSGFYLVRALEAWDGPSATSPFGVRQLAGSAVAQLAPTEVSRFAAVVLLSTRGLDKRARDAIAQSVRGGTGLVVTAGPDVEAAWVSAMFGWQPALTADPQQRTVALSVTDLRHPIFRPFGALAANLGQVRFQRTWRVQPRGWDTAARFTDGSAALLERVEGKGRVVLFASDLDRGWNDFPVHQTFVPFAVETLRYVAAAAVGRREFLLGSTPGDARLEPGVHREASGRTLVVNVDPTESTTARLTAAEFAGMLDEVAAAAASDPLAGARQAESRQGYWRYGLLLMLAALVAESFVGRARGLRKI